MSLFQCFNFISAETFKAEQRNQRNVYGCYMPPRITILLTSKALIGSLQKNLATLPALIGKMDEWFFLPLTITAGICSYLLVNVTVINLPVYYCIPTNMLLFAPALNVKALYSGWVNGQLRDYHSCLSTTAALCSAVKHTQSYLDALPGKADRWCRRWLTVRWGFGLCSLGHPPPAPPGGGVFWQWLCANDHRRSRHPQVRAVL